jgi:hypothetical protein
MDERDQSCDDSQPQPLPPVTSEELRSIDLSAILADLRDADDYAVQDRLFEHATRSEEEGEAVRGRVCRLLGQIMSIHVDHGNPSAPFGPMFVMNNGRGMIPDDIAGEQSATLAELVPELPHRALRAKVGDVVFYNNRKHHRAAAAAIDAYCEIAIGRLNDTIIPRFPGLSTTIADVTQPIARATTLNRRIRKNDDFPQNVKDAFAACYEAARHDDHYMTFVELSEIGWRLGLVPVEQILSDAKRLASAAPVGTYPEAVKRVWILAGQCHGALKQEDEANRCFVLAAEQSLRMRDESTQSSVKGHWTKVAIGELRSLKGTSQRVAVLRDELRKFQADSQDEFGSFSTPLDLDDTRATIEKIFDDISFSDACLHLANMAAPPSASELREIVIDLARKNPLSAMIGGSYHDSEGKEIARIEGMPTEGEPSDDWFKAKSAEYMGIAMAQQVRGKIEPARVMVMDRWPIHNRHLLPVIEASPFIPEGRHPLFMRGFAHAFQGDYITACHLLFPQLENSLRHILILTNRDPSKIEADLTQGDRTLSTMLDLNRSDLETVLGADIVYQLDILFNFRPGPALRNELAHGKLSAGAFHSDAAKYACWVMFDMVCRPLLRIWKDRIAPALNEEAAY